MSTTTTQPHEPTDRSSKTSGSSYIAAAFFAVAAAYPITRMAMLALQERGVTSDAAGVNFGAVLNDASFRSGLGSLALLAVAVSLLGVLIAATVGYALSRSRREPRTLPHVGFTGAQLLARIILLLPLYLVAMVLGLINAHVAIVLLYVGTVLPLCILHVKRSYDAIPRAIEDAAALDGCSGGQSFRLVLLPLIRPALIVTALVSFSTIWGGFFIAAAVDNLRLFATALGSADSAQALQSNVGIYAAAALVASLPAMLLLPLLSRYRGSRVLLESGDR